MYSSVPSVSNPGYSVHDHDAASAIDQLAGGDQAGQSRAYHDDISVHDATP
jgi:hypothetical protein